MLSQVAGASLRLGYLRGLLCRMASPIRSAARWSGTHEDGPVTTALHFGFSKEPCTFVATQNAWHLLSRSYRADRAHRPYFTE